MTVWHPIETAPRDGTEIVIWNSRYDYCPIAKWISTDDVSGWELRDFHSPCTSVEDSFIGWNEDIEDGFMPTRWMPLPVAEKP